MMKNQTREDYYAQIEEIYAQKYESKLHKWQKTREDYYAQIEDIYAQMYGDSHATRLLYRSKKENPEDQICNDEELAEIEAETKSSGSEDRAVENEANATMISAIDKEESMPQFQVPVSDSEILKSIEFGKVDLGLEKLEHVVMNEDLEQEGDQMNVNEKLEVDGDVERGQKMMSNTKICSAHQLLDQMPSKEKRMKHLKAWKFKFKSTSKRSRLMDDKFSFVDATVLLNKEPQETIWDCVKKEFKETMAGCGKTRVDRFKLVHVTSRPGVYDRPLQSSVWDRGGSLLECVDEESFGDDKIKEWLFKVEEFFSIDFTPIELKVKLVSNHFDGDAANWHQSQVQTGQFGHLLTDWSAYKVLLKERFENVFEDSIAELKQLQETKEVEDDIEPVTDKEMLVMPQIAVNANLEFSDYNNKMMKGKTELLATSQKMQKMDFFSFGIHTEMEENVELKQLLVAMERGSQEVIAQKIESGLSCGDVKFHLKHKWRFRLLKSFSRLVLLAWIHPWFSKAYEFSGQLQDSSKGEAESFPFLGFAAGQHLLWMQNNSEPIFIVSGLERKKKLCYKTWMFKYKVEEVSASEESRSRSRRKLTKVMITYKNSLGKSYDKNVEIVAWSKSPGRSEISCEVDAFGDQESSKFRKFAVAFMDISTVAKTQGLGSVHVLHKDAVLDSKLSYLMGNMMGEDQKQQGDSELLVIVLECVDAKGRFGMDKKPLHLSLRNRVWDPGG